MTYLYLRKSGRVEIREAHSTPRGPRSRTLASFRGALTDEHLDRAESASTRPFDREALLRRAAELAVPIERASADSDARSLVARLRSGARLDPVLAGALREQLDDRASAPVPDELADVIEWIGASDHERGLALRDVLRLYDTIARSRDKVHEPEVEHYPKFAVQPERRAS
jgi:hypothetical protein